ncbi:MAG TPA: hypothetical protein ENI89_08320 [Desulfobulbus sp.]|nr:hypothetical protein [Desulfobulbus sp.]
MIFDPSRYVAPGIGGPQGFKPIRKNIYLPVQAQVQEVCRENDLVKTFVFEFGDPLVNQEFTYEPGQFMMVSMPHCGEAPISFSSSPSRGGSFALTVRRAGRLTTAMHRLRPGDTIGVRGPYGRPFPMAELAGRNLLFVAGGIGLAPLRSVISFCLDNRADHGDITLLYGCRTPADICFADDLEHWRQAGVTCLCTVDEGDGSWPGRVGLVTELLPEVEVDAASWRALVCGPGVMIHFVVSRLLEMGFPRAHIYTTLERHMKCGVGICGHCFLEEKLICREGPVFSLNELDDTRNL